MQPECNVFEYREQDKRKCGGFRFVVTHLRKVCTLSVVAAIAVVTLLMSSSTAVAQEEPALSAGDPVAGAAKAMICMGCHGLDGNSFVPTFPKLAGQGVDYLVKELFDFRSGQRFDPMMLGIVAGLTEDDIVNLAAYFGSQELRAGAANPAVVEVGERLYREGRPEDNLPPCAGCHGLRGEGFPGVIEGGFPGVSGQHAAYTLKQLNDFRAGTRSNDWSGVMQFVTSRLTEEDMVVLSEYLSGLSRHKP